MVRILPRSKGNPNKTEQETFLRFCDIKWSLRVGLSVVVGIGASICFAVGEKREQGKLYLPSHVLGNLVFASQPSVIRSRGCWRSVSFLGLWVIAVKIYFQTMRNYPARTEKQPLGVRSPPPHPHPRPHHLLCLVWFCEKSLRKTTFFQFLLLKDVAWGFQSARETGLFDLLATDLPHLPSIYAAHRGHRDVSLRIALTTLWASCLLCPQLKIPRRIFTWADYPV